MASSICFLSHFTSITLLPLTLPFCLSPIFIVYIPRLGASIIPEDELPIKQIEFFNI